ncbi:MAG: hypothetical protein L0G87_00935 [Renibacterium salmoninarum]|nr:hypothetical protein [Renibacterium salmoninarum]
MPIQYTTIGPGKLTIGSDTALTRFESQCTSCKWVPDVKKGDKITVLSGEQVPGKRTESSTLEGSFLQDFGKTKSTTEWLFQNRGLTMPFYYQPNNKDAKAISGSLVVEAIDIGGDVEDNPTSDFKFEIIGAPSIIPATT